MGSKHLLPNKYGGTGDGTAAWHKTGDKPASGAVSKLPAITSPADADPLLGTLHKNPDGTVELVTAVRELDVPEEFPEVERATMEYNPSTMGYLLTVYFAGKKVAREYITAEMARDRGAICNPVAALFWDMIERHREGTLTYLHIYA